MKPRRFAHVLLTAGTITGLAACVVPDMEVVDMLPGAGGAAGSSGATSGNAGSVDRGGGGSGGSAGTGGATAGSKAEAGAAGAGVELGAGGAGGDDGGGPVHFNACDTKSPAIFCDSFEDGTTDKWEAGAARVKVVGAGDFKTSSHVLHTTMQAVRPLSAFAKTKGDAKFSFWMRTAEGAKDQRLVGFLTLTGAYISLSIVGSHYVFHLSTNPPVLAPSTTNLAPAVVSNSWICVEVTRTKTSLSARLVLPDKTFQALPPVDGTATAGEDDQWFTKTGGAYDWGDGVWQIGDVLTDLEVDDVRVNAINEESVCDVGIKP